MSDPIDRGVFDVFDGDVPRGQAARVMRGVFGEHAGGEALFRAFLLEKDQKPGRASFWVEVYQELRRDAAQG